MPILLMALATIRSLETPGIDLKWGMWVTAGYTFLVTVILAVTPREEEGDIIIGLTKYPERFAAVAATALLGLAALFLIWRSKSRKLSYIRWLTGALSVMIVAYSITFIAMGKCHSDDMDFIRDVALDGRYELDLDDSAFARSDLYDSMDNLGMFWHLPNLQAFHSIVPTSLMEFYPKTGVKRDVSSKPETKYYQLRSLLSTRWFFVKEDEENQENLMPGWELVSNQLGYNIYENQYWIPMGFTYDYYITVRDWEDLPQERRAAALLRVLVLKNEAAVRHSDILERMPLENYEYLDKTDYETDCNNRRQTAGSLFEIDNRGFTSEIDLPKENLVFYSVPYDSGWSAFVNDQPAVIEKVDIGFMAVRAPAGHNVIRFVYHTPGLALGIGLSVAGIIILGIFLCLCHFFLPPRRKRNHCFDRKYAALPGIEYQIPAPPFGDMEENFILPDFDQKPIDSEENSPDTGGMESEQ